MFENGEKDLFTGENMLDLGSDFGDMDNLFADELMQEAEVPKANEPSSEETSQKETNATETSLPPETESESEETKESEEEEKDETQIRTPQKSGAPEEKDTGSTGQDAEEIVNPFDAAIAKAKDKQAEATKNSLQDKLPVFCYANAKEEIVDPSITFDKLRDEKAEDFSELDDPDAVSWKITYAGITKNVTSPKKMTVISMKNKIEETKEFMTALKKAKGEVVCKVQPSVRSKNKGVMAAYKGVYPSVEEAQKSGKAISYVPSEDGMVYEVRCNRAGTFIGKAKKVNILPKVSAGFIPALPKIPRKLIEQILSFFKVMGKAEAMACIYWSVEEECYYTYVPKQIVTSVRIVSELPEVDEEKFVLVMEIHSHNTMEAFFSEIDNKDERATGLYAVAGRLDRLFPEIRVRMALNGEFIEINPHTVFDFPEAEYPAYWRDAVMVKNTMAKKEMFL